LHHQAIVWHPITGSNRVGKVLEARPIHICMRYCLAEGKVIETSTLSTMAGYSTPFWHLAATFYSLLYVRSRWQFAHTSSHLSISATIRDHAAFSFIMVATLFIFVPVT